VPSLAELRSGAFLAPDDGTLALDVVAGLAWAGWLVLTASVVLEVVAAVRRAPAPRLPGLALPQALASRLVAAAALLFVGVPSAVPASSQPAVPVSFPASLAAPSEAACPTPTLPGDQQTAAGQTKGGSATPTETYTTRRGDSLWKIAERQLGDGRRYIELVDLNRDALQGRPDFIPVGMKLQVPAHGRPEVSDSYVVEPGDTLSEIAQRELGDPQRFDEIFIASLDTVQPDGARLSDPDLIDPGWRLTIPRPGREDIQEPATASPAQPTTEPEPPFVTPPAARSTTPSAQAPPPSASPKTAAEPTREGHAPGWALPGLLGGGSLLAGGLLLTLRAHRRTQLRFRRPGHLVGSPPQEFLATEKTLQFSGTSRLDKLRALDELLRGLGTEGSPPALHTAELGEDSVTVRLLHPATLPHPWAGEGTTWSAALADATTARGSAPYPLLVTVGQGDEGHLWLVNLAALRLVTLGGDPARAEDFARHVVAELAVNPWSTRVDIDAVGIADELASLSYRVTTSDENGETHLRRLTGLLEDERDDPGWDAESYSVIVSTRASDALDLSDQLSHSTSRRCAAVLVNQSSDRAVELNFTPSGRVRLPKEAAEVHAAGLSIVEARACAGILDATTAAENIESPVSTTDSSAFADVTGAVRKDLTDARSEPAGAASLLPLETKAYIEVAATSSEDIETLAPAVPSSVGDDIVAADPDLGNEVAEWFDSGSLRPKLTLLGSVSGRAHGEPKVVANRKAFYVELLAYLALHPRGVTSDEVATAFSLTKDRAYVDLTHLRKWLGTNRATGDPYMPRLKATRGPREASESRYRVDGVLCDLDLFRRLRLRGQARGADGVEDLVQALRLVAGPPFSHLRDTGWTWLLEGERLDHVITCSIVDVAHIVTTHALASQDLDLARSAAETAYTAAPYDDVARLDLIQVAALSGHAEIAERHLVDGILNRSDDDSGPIDLPPRTAQVSRRLAQERRADAG
jgi:nucleoid-associated protein YgaU